MVSLCRRGSAGSELSLALAFANKENGNNAFEKLVFFFITVFQNYVPRSVLDDEDGGHLAREAPAVPTLVVVVVDVIVV